MEHRIIWGIIGSRVSQNRGTLRGPYYKEYSILGFMLGSPYFGKLRQFQTAKVVTLRDV